MARVTVEDCIERVPNRFELVLVAARRARDIAAGGQLTVDRDDDKNPVVALREIAEDRISPVELQNALVTGLQRQPDIDEPEEDDRELTIGDGDWPAGAGREAVAEELSDDMLFVSEDEPDGEIEPDLDEDLPDDGVEPASIVTDDDL